MQYFLLLCALGAFAGALLMFVSLQLPTALLAAIGGAILLGMAYVVAALKDVVSRQP